MAATDTVRGWYRETLSNHDQRGTSGYEPRCNWGIAVTVDFPNQSGGHYSEPVHPATAEAWRVYTRLMELHGVKMSSGGGVNSCRNIAGTNWPSLHAYLVACDLPPNNYKPQAFIDDVLAVRTNSGAQVFLNGAVFNDRMHDQINCSQSDLATGIDPTSLPFDIGETMFIAAQGTDAHRDHGWPDKGPVVEYWQHFMRRLDPSYDPGVGGWGDANSAEFKAELAKFSPGPPVIGPGEKLALEVRLAETVAPEPPDTGLTRAQVVALIEAANLKVPR